ncbi:hypothetical protein CcaCcLH18_12556 [Colletotrichum camelliae]|nr:hypothetical protein CcaCcLH18_12556 [Colletotrichum camelliae]
MDIDMTPNEEPLGDVHIQSKSSTNATAEGLVHADGHCEIKKTFKHNIDDIYTAKNRRREAELSKAKSCDAISV